MSQLLTPNVAPLIKEATGFDNDVLETLRDRQDFESGNVSNSTISFYPNDASNSAVASNYESNDLPGDFSHTLLAMGFAWSVQTIWTSPAASNQLAIEDIADTIRNSRIHLTADRDNKELLNIGAKEIFDFENGIQLQNTSFDDGTDQGLYQQLQFTGQHLYQLIEPLVIDNGQRFSLDWDFEDASAIPAASGYNNAQTPGVFAFLYVARPEA